MVATPRDSRDVSSAKDPSQEERKVIDAASSGTRIRIRKPRGYVGRLHETLGSDIVSVYRILKLPEQVLGAAEAERLKAVRTSEWYPIAWLLELMNILDAALGYDGLLRMGRALFDLSHKERVLKTAHSARDIIYGIDGMYRHANRGHGIGGWKVLRFEPGYAELEKTTPHHCIMEQGILSAALAAVGCPATIAQPTCFRDGADACVYAISSSLVDARWSTPTATLRQDPKVR